jgi:hypothetical protein
MKLLTTQNNKLLKNGKFDYKSFGIHLSPYNISGKNVCPDASKGCAQSCLNSSGFGRFSNVQKARLEKTMMFHNTKEQFMLQLKKEINAKINTAKKTNQKISFRLNLTSDIAWEYIKVEGKNLMEHFPQVQFMDYTKNVKRMLNHVSGNFPSNYHLTFSRSESNQNATDVIIGCGGNVAVVFDNKLPKTYKGKKVIDATISDLRFLDKKGTISGLIALGKAKKDTSGFVVKTRK